MIQPRLALSFVPCLLLALPLAAQDPIQLTPAAAGASQAFTQKVTQKQNFDVGGQSMEANQETVADFVATITAVAEDGVRSVKVVLVRIHGSFEIPMQDAIEFDTGKPAAADQSGLQAGVATLAGKEFTAKIGADGKVTDIAGFADTAAAARKAAGDQAQFVESMVADNTLAGFVRGAIGPLPKEAVAIGAKWSRAEDSGTTILMKRTMEYALAKADADTAEITVTGTLVAKEGSAPKGQMADAKVENGKIEGKTIVSRKDGFAVRSDVKSTFTVVAMGGQMEIDIAIQTAVERAGSKPAAKAEPAADPKPAK